MDGIAILMKCGWSREEAMKRASQGFKGRPVGMSIADLNEAKYGDGVNDDGAYAGSCKDACRMADTLCSADYGAKQGADWETHNVIGG